MPPRYNLRSSTKASSSLNSKNEQEPILLTYDRRIDKHKEEEMDACICDAIEGIADNSDSELIKSSIVLSMISFFQDPPPADNRLLNVFKNEQFLRENCLLRELLASCVRKEKFGAVRDLALLRPINDHDPTTALTKSHGELFSRLQLVVQSLNQNQWTRDDLIKNGAVIHDEGSFGDNFQINKIQAHLLKRRTYFEEVNLEERLNEGSSKHEIKQLTSLDVARGSYPDAFKQLFEATSDAASQTVTHSREFSSFYNLMRCFETDTIQAVPFSSFSALHGSFTANFIHPALFYRTIDEPIEKTKIFYQENKPWFIPVFIRLNSASSASNEWCRFSPRSDWNIVSHDLGIPLLLAEVVSRSDHADEYRMLVRSIALARVGSYLMKEEDMPLQESKKWGKMKETEGREFFVLAVYLDESLIARRYILKPENKTPTAKVHIWLKTFDLKNSTQACSFLLEMLNSYSLLEDLADGLDGGKEKELKEFKSAVRVWKISQRHGDHDDEHQ